jgi:hypothetical protein
LREIIVKFTISEEICTCKWDRRGVIGEHTAQEDNITVLGADEANSPKVQVVSNFSFGEAGQENCPKDQKRHPCVY